MDLQLDEQLLDDADALAAADPGGMLRSIAGSGAQVREASTFAAEAGVEALADERPRAIVLSAVGSSAAACEVLRALLADDVPLPLVEASGPALPRWVGPLDLVIAVSRSGTASPTLDAVAEAGRRGCRVVTIASPRSPLSVLGDQVRGLTLPVDKAARHTRASLWSLAVPLLAVADALGLVAVPAGEFALAADRLDMTAEICRPGSESFVNPAKRLALDLAGNLPVVWGAGALCRVAAKRFARQLHANAKYPALDGGLQEAAHGTVALFDGPFAEAPAEDVFHDPFEDPTPKSMPLRVVLMRDAIESENETDGGLRRAAEYLANQRAVRTSELLADAGRPIERLAQLIALGDFASVYLGLGLGLDPSPTRSVLEMKERIDSARERRGG
ncbi:MAG: glucose/mannose-6-phosphate isomerase [Actinomycetota bacterium]|jgi:glucose/mannose-6-phosphate isomerase|nr:glucose/mannose-6-phosphate isomerase [Actinomycetota bacterium]